MFHPESEFCLTLPAITMEAVHGQEVDFAISDQTNNEVSRAQNSNMVSGEVTESDENINNEIDSILARLKVLTSS